MSTATKNETRVTLRDRADIDLTGEPWDVVAGAAMYAAVTEGGATLDVGGASVEIGFELLTGGRPAMGLSASGDGVPIGLWRELYDAAAAHNTDAIGVWAVTDLQTGAWY